MPKKLSPETEKALKEAEAMIRKQAEIEDDCPAAPETKGMNNDRLREEAVKEQLKKAACGDTKAFSAIVAYLVQKDKIELESSQKFNPDDFMKAYYEAVAEKQIMIDETIISCLHNKELDTKENREELAEEVASVEGV